jgi:4-hydroxybenzoate polyprenyltransferase
MSEGKRREPGPLRRLAVLLRLKDVWDKVVHLAGCAALLWADGGRAGASWTDLVLYVAGVSLLLMGGYAVNDVADHRQDRQAEKRPGSPAPPRKHSLIAAAICLSIGTALTLAAAEGRPARALAAGAVLLGIAYSVPPVRFKERGIWGVLVGAAVQRPILFLVWSLTLGARGPLVVILALWLFLVGTTGILGHQLLDHERDRTSGVRTFVFRKGSVPAFGLGGASAAAAGLAALSPLALIPPERAWPIAAVLAAMTGVMVLKALRRRVRSRLLKF